MENNKRPNRNSVLQMSVPAQEWILGYPCGDGHSGFMLWGIPGEETLSFNHEALFRHSIQKEIKLAPMMDRIRQLVLNGRCKEAEDMILKATEDLEPQCNPFQCFCDLQFRFSARIQNYGRSLSLREGVTRIQNDSYRMEAFTDQSSGTNVAKLWFDRPTDVMLCYDRETDPECSFCCSSQNSTFHFQGRFTENVEFWADTLLQTDGAVQYGQSVAVTGCTWLETRTVLAIVPEKAVPLQLPYEKQKQTHMALFAEKQDRFSFSVGAEDRNSETIWNNVAKGEQFDPALLEYYVNLAKYVYISAGGGLLPMNLQGLWCGTINPMWSCGYTTDINVQMAYMPANAMGFGDYQMALFNWIDSHTAVMEKQCADIFGVSDAAYIPQYTDADMVPATWRDYAPFQLLWSGGAAWLSRHYYEYWKYTGDNAFMLQRGLPFMKRCARFYESFLTRTPEGKFRICPSCNPENWTVNKDLMMDSATMDLAIIHDLMGNLLDVCDTLKLQEPKTAVWRVIDADLVDYPIGADGALREYWTDLPVCDESHRHLSHIYGLHPARLFEDEPALREAARKAQEKRLQKGLAATSSWALSWHACIAARAGDGDRSITCIRDLFEGMVMENYLPSHNDWREGTRFSHHPRVFQIDAIFGICAAIMEMLAYSGKNYLALLPAIPKEMQEEGSVTGLCGYSGVVCDIRWQHGTVTALTVRVPEDMALQLRCGLAGLPERTYYLKQGSNKLI